MIEYELISSRPANGLIDTILLNRGVQNPSEFLNLFDKDYTPPSSLEFKNMKEGAKMLVHHVFNNDKMFVQIDSDCDGLTSAALFINYLNILFPHYAQANITYRLHDEKVHGLINMDIIPEDTKIIVIPDAGSNEYELHKKCKERGIDVLILDHHVAEYESPYACVINNQLCDYPTKSLSGVGVVYKFCKFLDSLTHADYADKFLDLVSLGMIADMMDTRDYETQYLIQKGLKQIRNPLFQELMRRDEMHFPPEKDPLMVDVAWYIAPTINAVTRVGTPQEKILTFEAMLEFRAYEQIPSTKRGCKGQSETRAEQAGRTASNIKNRQGTEVDNAIKYITKMIEENELEEHKIIPICISNPDMVSKNLNGLVANKLSSDYQRPSFVLQKVVNAYGVSWQGSARGYDKSALQNFQQFLLDSGLVMYAQGHPNAFGVGVKDENMPKLIEYCDKNLNMLDGTIKYNVDFEWYAPSINTDDILDIASFKYLWGQKIEEPKIALTHVRLAKDTVQFIGKNGKTLKITVGNTNMIKFFCSDEDIENLQVGDQTWIANAIVTCDINEWNGRQTPQLKLVDLEIVKKQQWYF